MKIFSLLVVSGKAAKDLQKVVVKIFAFVVFLFFVSTACAAAPVGCGRVKTPNDGASGFLWKESDHGGLVVLFPTNYQSQFQKVLVLKKRKKTKRRFKRLASLRFSGFANGNRQHWRDSRSINRFPNKRLYLKALDDSGKSLCYIIKKPHERND